MPKHHHAYKRTSAEEDEPATPPDVVTASADDATTHSDLLARFSDSIALLTVAHTSLASKELTGTGDEEVALRHVLEGLKTIYNDLDGSLAGGG